MNTQRLAGLFLDPQCFSAGLGGLRLRGYQLEVARAIVDSVVHGRGRTFVVMFPRQSGKNELQAQIEALLLALYSRAGGEMVKISPTLRPQSVNAMRRLERVLESNLWFRAQRWSCERGHIYRAGRASLTFLSGAPEANIVGATASLLLEVDEAQDVSIEKYDKEILPMAASTNATRVLWGTAWTSQTLLGRELRAARAVERAAREAGERPFTRRVYVLTADEVAAEVPAYGAFVAGQVARLGRQHPMVRTQFYSEEIDGQGGLFPPERLGRMRTPTSTGGTPTSTGGTPEGGRRADGPQEGKVYALLLDVGGENAARGNAHSQEEGAGWMGGDPVDRGAGAAEPRGEDDAAHQNVAHRDHDAAHRDHDATALTIVEVDRSTLADPLRRAPTYRVVGRRLWVGEDHTRVYGEVRALAQAYRARWVVVDATGVGAGLAAFLRRALPGRVMPFTFSLASKSRLGWDFTALVDQGRWIDAPEPGALDELFFQQAAFCRYEILPGPGRLLRWGVPDGARDPASGRPVHDDLLVSAALASVLDRLEWPLPGTGSLALVRAPDPLDGMRGF